MLTWTGCCPGCETPQLDGLAAINKSSQDKYHQSQCPVPEPCPDCEACPNGALFSYCDGGACVGADLSKQKLSSCTEASQCKLRWGTACWEHCGGSPYCGDLTAIRKDAEKSFQELTCGPNEPPPPPCVPSYPENAIAECHEGHCQAVLLEGSD